MAKDNDDWLGLLLVGGLGFLFGKSNSDQNQKLGQYVTYEKNLQEYLLHKMEFEGFRKFQNEIQEMIHQLQPLPDKTRLKKNKTVYKLLVDAVNMYSLKLYRWSAIASSGTIEHLLYQKYQINNFRGLIDKAKEDNLISNAESHLLHGLRLNRNDFVHNLEEEVSQEDCKIMIQIAGKLINKLILIENGELLHP